MIAAGLAIIGAGHFYASRGLIRKFTKDLQGIHVAEPNITRVRVRLE